MADGESNETGEMLRFDQGVKVQVRPGVFDFAFPEMPLSGWRGIVRETSFDMDGQRPLYLIEWDEETLQHVAPKFRELCARLECPLESMYLADEELDLATDAPLAIEEPKPEALEKVLERDVRVRGILEHEGEGELPALTLQNLALFETYLRSQLELPFAGSFEDDETDDDQPERRNVSVDEIIPASQLDEETDGLLCKVSEGEHALLVALLDIDVEADAPSHGPLRDYSYWIYHAMPAVEDDRFPVDSAWIEAYENRQKALEAIETVEPYPMPKPVPAKPRRSASAGNDLPMRSLIKAGRNDPCPCGSGKKFKKCCLPRSG